MYYMFMYCVCTVRHEGGKYDIFIICKLAHEKKKFKCNRTHNIRIMYLL